MNPEETQIQVSPFVGFDSPQSNTTYVPNQFFDVVLPNAKNTGVTAPICTPRSPRKSETFAMRLNSNKIVRIHCARGGASTSIKRSAAMMKGTSLAKLESQSIRLIRVVT